VKSFHVRLWDFQEMLPFTGKKYKKREEVNISKKRSLEGSQHGSWIKSSRSTYGEKKNFFSSVDSRSNNTVFLASDSFAAGLDSLFDRRFDYTSESSS
jgi:hypothetical protein